MSSWPHARFSVTQAAQFADAARVLGARPLRLAWQITLPLARPAIAVGVALALLETLNDIGASEYLGVQTLTVAIFTTWLNRGSLAGAAQIACVMLLFVAALIALERYGRQRRTYSALTQQGSRFSARIVLHGSARWIAAVACFVPAVFGFLVPAGYLAVGGDIARPHRRLRPCSYSAHHHDGAARFRRHAVVLVVGFSAVAAVRYLRQAFSPPASVLRASATPSPAPCWRSAS